MNNLLVLGGESDMECRKPVMKLRTDKLATSACTKPLNAVATPVNRHIW